MNNYCEYNVNVYLNVSSGMARLPILSSITPQDQMAVIFKVSGFDPYRIFQQK